MSSEVSDEPSYPSGEGARVSLRPHLACFLGSASPRVLIGNAVALWAVRAGLGLPGPGDVVVVLGIMALWPVMEWVAHRYILHLRPRTVWGVRVDPMFAQAHRAHHREPGRLRTLFLPLPVILPLVPIQVALWWALMPTAALALTAAAAFATMAVAYEWAHYLAHTQYQPAWAWVARVQRNHRLHHFRHERNWYAFLCPHVDAALGTDPPLDGLTRSSTTRTLGVDEVA